MPNFTKKLLRIVYKREVNLLSLTGLKINKSYKRSIYPNHIGKNTLEQKNNLR
jgi:hypothetical protein